MTLDDFLTGVETVAIAGHIKPDGDCVGSSLGVYGYIKENYPKIHVEVFLEKSSAKMTFLQDFCCINNDYPEREGFDLMICVDCATKERLGMAVKYFDSAAKTINIDHHVSNANYADDNYVFGGLSSCCEALFSFMVKEKVTKDVATALYVGIISDTGVFKYDSTTPTTMRVAAELMEFGIDTNFIIDESFYAKNYNENRILGYALANSILLYDGRVIYSVILNSDLDRFNVSSIELEGIVSQLKLTRGVQVALFIHQVGEDEYKVSLRSNEKADVNKIASAFGGGGHVRASGATVKGKLEACLEKLLNEISKEIK